MKENSAYLIEAEIEALEDSCASPGKKGYISVCVGINDIRKALDIAEGALLKKNLKPFNIYSVHSIGVEMLEDLDEPLPSEKELKDIEKSNGIWFSDFEVLDLDLKDE